MTALVIAELSQATIEGTGTFDVLMRAVKAHLEQEFIKGRIKGPEYSTVYLSALDLAMQQGLNFLLNKRKNDLEAQLLEKQILLATQQLANLTAEAANIPKQGALLDAQVLTAEKQTSLLDQQRINLISEELGIDAKTALTTQQMESESLRNYIHPTDVTLSGSIDQERQIGKATVCKLDAEFDNIQAQTLRVAEELALLTQKTATEKAQTLAIGVDADSVVGKQKSLYTAQTAGFARDAEQKAAKLLADTWSVRRTTDEGTIADGTNMLNDTAVGRAINKLLTGVGA